MDHAKIVSLLGSEAEDLLSHSCQTISKESIRQPTPDYVDESFGLSNRSPQVLRNLQTMFDHGRLSGTGYISILPVDQGIEHTAGASFAPNPMYFDGENIIRLAIEGGCNAVATTFGVLAQNSRKYAHKIPFVVKINHNELGI
jgi:class I fructose-bisphosphate aldolase